MPEPPAAPPGEIIGGVIVLGDDPPEVRLLREDPAPCEHEPGELVSPGPPAVRLCRKCGERVEGKG